MSKELRPYQAEAIASIRSELRRGARRALCVLPCGAGKAFILARLLAELVEKNPSLRALVLVPKVKLVQQLSSELSGAGVAHGVYCATLRSHKVASIVLGTYQSVARMVTDSRFDFIVADEAHNLNPMDKNSLSYSITERHSHEDTRVVGFTATPYRGARPLWALGDYWPRPCFTLSITELTRMGYLVPARLVGGAHAYDTSKLHIKAGEWDPSEVAELARDTAKMQAQIKDALPRLNGCHKVVWVCVDQEHARRVCALLKNYKELAEVVISDNPWEEREDALSSFETGATRHLVSVNILLEGFDVPAVDAVVFLRPMRSIVGYVQACGRALRLYSVKTQATVLDYGGVVAACGPLDRPAVDTDGAAQDRARASREKLMEEMGYRVVRCEECGVFYFPPVAEAPPCPDCGHRQTIFERIKNTKDSAEAGELYAGLSEHEWMKSWVTGLHMELHEEALVLEFATKTLGRESKHIVTLYAPPYSGKPTPPQMGQLRRTKMWCRDYFGAPPHLAARAMCRWVIENAKVMPRMLRQLDSGDYVAEGSQPRSTVASLEEAQQERLL